ncbi:ABC transporter ATP-binding protein [Parvibaculum sp.]|nr:ABC transporter ATP-binding protein [Parvibaculum sp.]MBO6633408.1 ABC transporter ATP-binding protein [Parvibaculum sp.]MBO6679345.1 ABC transporter ATP-binding protein [Parvibaculum sp.]MBO6684631.1 ABC transporter ATP-binding protein [Parvibaculum sp.]MBO6904548.1 ABC transporter ATP-binding protein [Parvibaculum sp.]
MSDGNGRNFAGGYGEGSVDTVLSVGDVAREAEAIARTVPREEILALSKGAPFVSLEGLHAGYGAMEILHGVDLAVGKGQSLCLVGPNGAGKSTILHSIFGFTKISSGRIVADGRDVTRASPSEKLRDAGIAYILQNNSVFPDMTVEENLLMGGYLLADTRKAQEAAERVFARYDRLAARRSERARVLSGGERRLLEISRALIMDPDVLLVDEPSIGLEPRMIDMVFEILADLQTAQGKTILMVEQNAKRGLDFADVGYVLVAGRVALAGKGEALLENPDVGRLFLGG